MTFVWLPLVARTEQEQGLIGTLALLRLSLAWSSDPSLLSSSKLEQILQSLGILAVCVLCPK